MNNVFEHRKGVLITAIGLVIAAAVLSGIGIGYMLLHAGGSGLACPDGVKNGTQTDVDCGGTCAIDCAVGKACVVNGDCALPSSGKCTSGSCSAATCFDGVKNGTETDLDCGGSCAADCALEKGCALNTDCASAVCYQGLCKE